MAKEIQKRKDLKGLESIEDSILLLDGLFNFKKLVKIGPSRMQYPDLKAAEAKRPKRVEILPIEKQQIEAGGMYMFTVKTNNMKRAIYLAIAVVLGIGVLMWRVWPIWLRLGVWYVSYYLCIALVSNMIETHW
jgi:hypothetical protein